MSRVKWVSVLQSLSDKLTPEYWFLDEEGFLQFSKLLDPLNVSLMEFISQPGRYGHTWKTFLGSIL